jgi:hypothetical protein
LKDRLAERHWTRDRIGRVETLLRRLGFFPTTISARINSGKPCVSRVWASPPNWNLHLVNGEIEVAEEFAEVKPYSACVTPVSAEV